MTQLPVIYVIQSPDTSGQTDRLQEILRNLKSENRIAEFTTWDAEDDFSSHTEKIDKEDLILILLTDQLEPHKERIETIFNSIKTQKTGVRVAEIIIDNVVYDNRFLTFPSDLRPIQSRDDQEAVWNEIEQSLKKMLPVSEQKEQDQGSGPIDWPKYLKMAGIAIGVLLVFLVVRWVFIADQDSSTAIRSEQTETAQTEAVEASGRVWARGTTCLTPSQAFDLDQGAFETDGGDLFYENVDGRERYLRNWRGSALANGGEQPLDQVSFNDLETARYGNERLDASYGGGEVLQGTVWFVKTSEGRHGKIRILRSGHFMQFEWVTYAKQGERRRLAGSPFNNGTCSIEEEKNCGTGRLSGDQINGFRVAEKQPGEALVQVNLRFNPDHRRVFVVPLLLDADGENISRAYRPTAARQGETAVPVLFNLPGRARSEELLLYLFESGTPGEAFICRRFPLNEVWVSS